MDTKVSMQVLLRATGVGWGGVGGAKRKRFTFLSINRRAQVKGG
jgi:hypothetical protein